MNCCNRRLLLLLEDNGLTVDDIILKKSVALNYNLIREHVANSVVEMRKINTNEKIAEPSTKSTVRNYLHDFYHECMING